jgi:hypothetical protein
MSWTSIWTAWTEAQQNIILTRHSYITIRLCKRMTRKSTSVIVEDIACYKADLCIHNICIHRRYLIKRIKKERFSYSSMLFLNKIIYSIIVIYIFFL